MSTDNYVLDLESYTGPLDLLYLLIRQEEIPFEKISIAKIADGYLEYVRKIEEVDFSAAGDFLDLASRLMELKARELLPRESRSKEDLLDFEIEREALIMQTREYQRYKRVALGLKEMEEKNFGTYGRGRSERVSRDSQLADADILQLHKAFRNTLQARASHVYENKILTFEVDKVLIEDRQQHINTYLSQRGRAMFDQLLGKEILSMKKERACMIISVTFMAMLELAKTDDIVFRQSEVNGPIWLYRKKQNDEYKEELALEKIYYTPDPTVQPGLLDYLHGHSHALEIKERTSLDSVLKTAMQLIESGINVGETDIHAMLEGTMPKC